MVVQLNLLICLPFLRVAPGQVSSVNPILFKDPRRHDCDATKVEILWTEPDIFDRNSLITHYVVRDFNNHKDMFSHSSYTDNPFHTDDVSYSRLVTGIKADQHHVWEVGDWSSSFIIDALL